jgi:hypothetical protein
MSKNVIYESLTPALRLETGKLTFISRDCAVIYEHTVYEVTFGCHPSKVVFDRALGRRQNGDIGGFCYYQGSLCQLSSVGLSFIVNEVLCVLSEEMKW